jgi:cytochrome c oxidase subunit 2
MLPRKSITTYGQALGNTVLVLVLAATATGCSGIQSALAPAGTGARQILDLFWVMLAGAAVIWLVVIGIGVWAVRVRPAAHSRRTAMALIIGGGAVFPVVTLGALLGYGLFMLPQLRAPASDGSVRIEVVGEQWWWRVHYHLPDGERVVSANEVRLPTGTRTAIELTTADVIHSFWIPSLGGKVDMIPGRANRIVLEPTQAGIYRGVCAEYCGASHALMAFSVVAMPPEEFTAWLRREAQPAEPPEGALEIRGRRGFQANGCGGCHSIRGTAADGVIGPDLTHVGARLNLGAGTLENDLEGFMRWISATDEVKPDVRMPSYHVLPEDEIRAIAAYLEGLQ